MKPGIFLKGAAIALAATLGTAAWADWNRTIVETTGAHRIGNPKAKHQLIEFVSYTCPHCATFAKQADAPLKLAFIPDGDMSVEVRHIIRDPIDLTAAMLAQCGPASKFRQNHAAFMFSQDEWLPIARNATAAQRQRWSTGDYAARRRAIAGDFGFYKLMERRGYGRIELNRCLADNAKANAMAQQSAADMAQYELAGTPSFALDGKVLAKTHDWPTLERQLMALYKPK